MVINQWHVGEFMFEEVETSVVINGHTRWFRFFVRSVKPNNELYETLEHAMAEAIGQKYAGQRGAASTGVDSPAGWFMRMIGADGYRGMTTAEIRTAQSAEARKAEDDRLTEMSARGRERRNLARGSDELLG